MTDVPQDRQSNTLESEFIARLLDEYKILQDKIDKIGAFRFTIKGWSITVLVAVVFAGSATNVKPLWALAVCAIAVLVGLFLYEWQQTILRYCFGQRCVLIEEQITHLLRAAVKRNGSESLASSIVSLQYIPGIGRHVASAEVIQVKSHVCRVAGVLVEHHHCQLGAGCIQCGVADEQVGVGGALVRDRNGPKAVPGPVVIRIQLE